MLGMIVLGIIWWPAGSAPLPRPIGTSPSLRSPTLNAKLSLDRQA
ncbi:hypothetical protein [Nannocystis pusilla]